MWTAQIKRPYLNAPTQKERLLSFWEEEGTLRIINWAEQETSPSDKLARVIQASLHPSRLDVALRAWALQDEQGRAYQQRLAYLETLVFATTADRIVAQQLARVFYSLYVGSQHIIPPIEGEDLGAFSGVLKD